MSITSSSRPPLAQPSSANLSSPTNASASASGINRVNSASANNMMMMSSSSHLHNADRDSLGNNTFDDRRSDISGAGYSAYSGHRANDVEPTNYHIRLVRFYQRYNPEKIPRVAEFLEAYKGDEEELFKTLSQKYGPEPEPSVVSVGSRSETTTVRESRQIGVATVPKVVNPSDGNCDRDTPYYPSQRTIMESDLCNLLATKKTTHPDLVPAFVGYLSAHPSAAWNGMTYITNVPVPIDEESRFLGHLWAGSLSNTKTIIHDKMPFTRTVFHCGENCSSSHWVHERWRLTLIRADHTQDTLYRVLWDPVLSPAAAAELLKAAPNAVEQDRNSFFSFFKRQGSEKGSLKGALPQPSTSLSKSVPSSGFSSRSQQHAASQQQQLLQQQQQQAQVHHHHHHHSSSTPVLTGSNLLPAYPPPMTLAPNTTTTISAHPNQPTQPSSPSAANQHQQHVSSSSPLAVVTMPPSSSLSSSPPQPKNIAQPASLLQQQPPIISSTSRMTSAPSNNNIPQQPVTATSSSAPPTAAAAATHHHHHPHQPQQPHMVSSFDSLINLVQGLEGRLTERLNDIDKRLQAVEGDIVFLKEMSEQRQIEQLPEPWLDDGGTSHQGSSTAAGGRVHKKLKKEVSMKEKAQAVQRHMRKQHRKRLEQERNRLENEAANHDDDGTETVLTTSVGTSHGTSGYR